jgi:hypothetical protein
VTGTRAAIGVDRRQPAERPTTEEPLYRPLHTWLSGSVARRVTLAAAVLIAAQAVFRGWLALRGWFVGDDFAFIGRAYQYSLFDRHYLFLAYASHVMPGSFVLVWLFSHASAYNFVLPTLFDTAVQAFTGALMYRLLTALFGRRPVILVPLAVFLFTPITLPAFVWWAPALNQTPQQLALVAALLCQVRYLQHGRTWRGLAGALCVAFGLAFSEKTLLVVALIAAITLLYFTPGRPLPRIGRAWRWHWRVCLGYLFVAVPYGLYYALAVPTPAHSGATSGGVAQLGGYQVFHALIPGLIGGPWSWRPLGTNAALADPPPLAVVLALTVLAATLVVSIAMNHRASFGWLVLGAYELVNIGLLAISRAAIVGPLLGSEYRYSTDIALVATVCISLACIPLGTDFSRGRPQRLVPRESTRQLLARWRRSPLIEALPRVRLAPALGVGVAALLASAVVSSLGYVHIFAPNHARLLLHNAARELRHMPADVRVADAPVSEAAVWGMVYPYTLPSRLLKPYGITPQYLEPGQSTARFGVLDGAGHLRRAAINGILLPPGPDATCGYHLGAPGRRLVLPERTIIPWDWVIRIGYISARQSTGAVTAAGMTVPVTFHRGIGEVFVMVRGMVDTIDVGGLQRGASICSNEIAVGTPSAIPGSTP